ncbi:MAG: glycoside hydrolase family 15 protein [Rhodospirillales bacterium]
MSHPIEDYAMIGDCQTAALVCRDGSIDWLCLPRFDSPACFAALLGNSEHGRWLIAPEAEVKQVRRRYRGDTLILETRFETAAGVVNLIDFMPPRAEGADLVRIVEGVGGAVPMHMELVIRFDFGRVVPWVRGTREGIHATAGPDTLHLRSEVSVQGRDFRTVGSFTVQAGQRLASELLWTPSYGAARLPKFDPEHTLRTTEQWWKEWSGKSAYTGRWREAVQRSLITLKALTYSSTGGLVAAPTTSLPELPGSVRNWDYRYCWLRDAAFTLDALLVGGYREEARAWREWLVNSVAGSPSQVQIMYGVGGERRLAEWEVDWLPGYANSLPVRIGNAAYVQRQLDTFGEVMEALYQTLESGLHPDQNAWHIARELLDYVEEVWTQPDEGIWEMRSPQQHHTHSKVMCWVALDRAVKSVERHGVPGDVRKWRELRDRIRQDVLDKGFNSSVNAFVQSYGSTEPDASLLLLPLVKFLPAGDPRMLGTVRFIERHLLRDGFVARYRPGVDGLPPSESMFILCTFWYANNLALQGRREEARAIFERLLEIRNDVGLLSEDYDPAKRRLLGNFPQAFSHVGLINTARILDQQQQQETAV